MASSSAPILRYEIGSTVAPGDRLGSLRSVKSGIGTFVKGGNVYASLLGTLKLTENAEQPPVAQVQGSKPIAALQTLTVGQVTIGRVLRITSMQAFLEILATTSVMTGETILLKEPQQGAIRREDVRTGASEQVKINESFLPGDLVVCRVLALGDQRKYLLTTAAPELGVIYAESSKSGNQMIPSSWKEMTCPESGAKEPRKCARPRTIKTESHTS